MLSDLGGFESADPLWRQEPGRSPYHYVGGDPLRFVDPTGLQKTVMCVYDPGGDGGGGGLTVLGEGGINIRPPKVESEPEPASSQPKLESESSGTATESVATQSAGETPTQRATRLGKEEEAASGEPKNTKGVRMLDEQGKPTTRYPDHYDPDAKTMGEDKNTSRQALTKQLRIYINHAQTEGFTLTLKVRATTQLSGPLQAAIDRGELLLRYLGRGNN